MPGSIPVASPISAVTRLAYGSASVPTYGRPSDGLRPLGSSLILGVLGVRLRSATPCVGRTAFGLRGLLGSRPGLWTLCGRRSEVER